ncbi:hypothetical protein ACOSQ2_014017 [Xanthoceras sorbifolium]
MLFTVVVIEAAPKSAFVTHLPGFNGSFPSKHYSGYVSIENQGGVLPPKNLFYYFVESERDPSKDPLVLWLNGGPGCSSMDGFIYEHGPFNFAKEKSQTPTLHLNPYSWSKVSNIIYLDSPAGVGFSYCKNKTYVTDDIQTATDTHKFLLQWLKQYEEFSSNPFYISGESYAGIYIPTLAAQVHHGIKAGENPVINFKGYLIGNGVTDPEFDGNALVPFAHGMGLISDDIYEEVKAGCGGKYYSQPNTSDTCSEKLDKVDTAIASLNIYDILEPCYHDPSSMNKNDASNLKDKNNNISSSFLHELGKTERPLPVRTRMFGRAWPFRAPVMPGVVPSWPELLSYGSVPCVNDEVATVWLNDESVRKALHVAPAGITRSVVGIRHPLHHLRGKAVCALRSQVLQVDVLGEDLQSKVIEVFAFVAPKIIGGRNAPTPVGELGMVEMSQALDLIDVYYEQVGPDMLISGFLQSAKHKFLGESSTSTENTCSTL